MRGKRTFLVYLTHFHILNFLICNDSGAMHLANSVGTHVFALFSTTNPNLTGPIFNGPKNIIKVSFKDTDKCISEAVLSELKQFI
jgi:ADP-heptose:LPS heptosyltransferase